MTPATFAAMLALSSLCWVAGAHGACAAYLVLAVGVGHLEDLE